MLRHFAILACLILPAIPASAEMRLPESRAEIQMGFVPLVRQATPAVVNIYAKRIVAERVSPFRNDPFFGDLFRDFGETRPRVQNSLGSGVILTAGGLVVSNYHVVGQATDIRVVLGDRREYNARIVLHDEEADLAILQMENAGDLPVLALRDSDSVEVGELVLAIGNPFGVGQTVSSGIVSGLARSGAARGNGRGYFIQTDAAINPGNSGGALIDMAGRLIGVNTAILTRSGGSNGIGFAIPANLVAEFVRQAEAGNERFEKPWAGISGQPVDADIAASLGRDIPEGIVIAALHPDSPFAAAGFRAGDVILSVDGFPVNTPAEIVFRMAVTGLGKSASVARLRGDMFETVAVPMVAAPDTPPRDRRVLETTRSVMPGLVVSTINPAVIADYGLPISASGVLVEDPGPVGGRIGLRPGDVLLAINGLAVGTSGDVAAALSVQMRGLLLDVQRGAQRIQLRARF